MEERKRLLESALFISGKELGLEELSKLIGVGAPGYVKNLINELKEEYEKRNSAIEIVEFDGKFAMRLKEEYVEKVKQFAQETELTKSALRTLAYIAKNNGIEKSTLAKKLGSGIYGDVRELSERGFIKQVKAGRTKKLYLTPKFNQYFKKKI